jgi:predicted RecB family endonuclease
MKLINKDILVEYGFVQKEEDSKNNHVIMTRAKVDIVIKSDGTVYYSNLGIQYPLKDLSALRKLYKEIKNTELKPL